MSKIKQDKEQGFTLLEMLVVMAVMAVIAALVVPRLTNRQVAEELNVVTFLDTARQVAIKEGKPNQVVAGEAGLLNVLTGETLAFDGENTYRQLFKTEIDLPYRELTRIYSDGTFTAVKFVWNVPQDGEESSRFSVTLSPFRADPVVVLME